MVKSNDDQQRRRNYIKSKDCDVTTSKVKTMVVENRLKPIRLR